MSTKKVIKPTTRATSRERSDASPKTGEPSPNPPNVSQPQTSSSSTVIANRDTSFVSSMEAKLKQVVERMSAMMMENMQHMFNKMRLEISANYSLMEQKQKEID